MKVTENTLIPIGLAAIVLGGGGMWCTRMELKANANTEALQKLESRGDYYVKSIEGIGDKLSEIRERLVKIETQINRINRIKRGE